MDIIITVLKYLSLLIGSVSGIVGLVSDFRDKVTNKITRSGRRLLWLIVISGFLSIILQTLDLYSERNKSLAEIEKTNKLLTGLNRTLNPIKDIFVSYRIEIPLDDVGLKSYRNRLVTSLDSLTKKLSTLKSDQQNKILREEYGVFVTSRRSNSILQVELLPYSILLPNKITERLPFYVLQYGEVDYSFFNTEKQNIADTSKPDFRFYLISGIDGGGLGGQHRITCDLEKHALFIEAFQLKSDPQFWERTGRILSIPDLCEATLIMKLPSTMVSGDDKIDARLRQIRRKFELIDSYLHLSDGREIHFNNGAFKHIGSNDELPEYVFKFPSNLDDISSFK